MPSSQLAQLCQQIENQNTDHFGKFYMYVSLLNTLTVRNKTFADGLPKYHGPFWRKNTLDIGGELPVKFARQLNFYIREFTNSQPHWSKTLHNVVMAYVRKGKITDLTYIIDQMLDHLISMHDYPSHNKAIYNFVHFKEKKNSLIQFIEQISAFNHQLVSIADSGCNTVLSLLTLTAGLVLVITSVVSIIPLIIGLPLLIGGAYGAYHFMTQAEAQAKQLETQLTQIAEKIDELPKDDSFFGDRNYAAFYAAAFKPLPYAAITAGEQLTFNDAQQQKLSEYREALDTTFGILSI